MGWKLSIVQYAFVQNIDLDLGHADPEVIETALDQAAPSASNCWNSSPARQDWVPPTS